ncbi:hypothetical protein [Clostridium sp. C105KSO13]|jgi:hypothetical protein|uniref:hypothetical protein n=1 Tax=Clostridium sp. C105KSO13 TaxID=1776045 RepID=UPI000740634B|nr:hypothetical protein [Clostridium sp. C105KSO13]CUX18563.1 hypothetical protein BN3456_00295 [Clostridium sp. C105KSO13]
MLRLRNIKKNSGIISASYEPEDSGKIGMIKIDIDTGEVVEKELSDYDKDFPWHFSHAVKALKDLAKEDSMPDEKLVMWY